MKGRIEIRFLKQPEIGDEFRFTIKVNGVALNFGGLSEVKVNYPGADTPPYGVAVQARLAATVRHTWEQMEDYFSHAGLVYSAEYNSIFLHMDLAGDITVENVHDVTGRVQVLYSLADTLPAFDLLDLTIEVVDTYTNNRVLVEEFTQDHSPTLEWESGDTLYENFMTSKLTFNMLVNSEPDGHFLHLLTGDERRYLVKLSNIDENEVKTLIWQGYILPDLYSEPYKNGVLFVQFTAVDMLAALKGKFFEPWIYDNTLEISYLLGYILRETGFEQQIYVRPSLVNVSHGAAWKWRNLTVDMGQFVDDKRKFASLYDMLEAVLKAQGMVLYSYLGKWFLDGITRRGEATGAVEMYYPDGEYIQTITITRNVRTTQYNASPPHITAETPWRKVNINFTTKSDKNLLPEGIMKKETFRTSYSTVGGSFMNFMDTMLDSWKKIGTTPQYILRSIDQNQLNYGSNGSAIGGSINYGMGEAEAMINPIECQVKPTLVAGVKYEIEVKLEVSLGTFPGTPGEMQLAIASGPWQTLIPFRLFHDGVEIMSNRPGFPDASLYWFDVDSATSLGVSTICKVTLKRQFTVPYTGDVTFQMLPVIHRIVDYFSDGFRIYGESFKISVVEDYNSIESTSAVRDINYTRELDIDTPLTCTPDSGVQNSFGIAERLGVRFGQFLVSGAVPFEQIHYYTPQTWVTSYMYRWPISNFLQEYVFANDKQWSLFVENNGDTRDFHSVFTKTVANINYMAIYYDYVVSGVNPFGVKPNYREGYEPMQLPNPAAGDTLWLMLSQFTAENRSKRMLWKVYGAEDETAESYLKTLAKACHAVQPEVTFRVEAVALDLIFPGEVVYFDYIGMRKYIPTRLTLDLSAGKTTLTQTEVKLDLNTDIMYE